MRLSPPVSVLLSVVISCIPSASFLTVASPAGNFSHSSPTGPSSLDATTVKSSEDLNPAADTTRNPLKRSFAMCRGFLEKIKKKFKSIFIRMLVRIPAFQRNLAVPSEGMFGKIVTNLFTVHNKPTNQAILTEMLVKELSAYPNNSSYLELGFGPGHAMVTILSYYPNFGTLEGVDPSKEMHSICATNLKEHTDSDSTTKAINLTEGHGDDMPHIKDNSIDFIFHSNVIYFWNDMDQTLKELGRVLKSDGSGLMASETSFQGAGQMNKNVFKNRSMQDYLEALERNGFEVVRTDHVGAVGPELILARKKAT